MHEQLLLDAGWTSGRHNLWTGANGVMLRIDTDVLEDVEWAIQYDVKMGRTLDDMCRALAS